MVLIHDLVTAPNVAGYWNKTREQVDKTNGDKLFPNKKQLGLKLAFVKGAAGRPVVLRASAFDTPATLRERMAIDIKEDEMPYFKEGMLVKEEDRQQLNQIRQDGNKGLIDTILKGIYDDQSRLVSGALARIESMRMQVLATGKIAVKSNGQGYDYDYGVPTENKGTVATAWSDAAKATPLADIEESIAKLEEQGGSAELIIMNAKTFSQLKKAASTVVLVKPLAPKGSAVTKAELKAYLEDELQVKIVIENGTFIDDDGVAKKYYPDGHITIAPNSALGYTVFGTTPEESDLMGGNVTDAKVQLVETGIAITTTRTTDPVNVQTKVSMITLPSFEQLDKVYMLDVEP